MADHLQHRATDAQGIDGTDPQEHKTHVTHRAAGNTSFDVVLGKGVQSAIDDVHDPEDHQCGCQLEVGLRKHLDVEAQKGIAAHLQQNAGQQHRDGGIGFPVGIRQPGVEREHRQLHPEADQESEVAEKPEGAARGPCRQFTQIEGEDIT